MRRFAAAAVFLIALLAWWLTMPSTLSEDDLPAHLADPVAGERIFWAGGCASCHASPIDGKRAKGAAKLLLGGGMQLQSPYGVFRAPNISPHEDGIAGWSMLEFVNAMQRGVSPNGRHYYPSFPYTSYARAAIEDVMDLKVYLDTLLPVAGRTEDHSLGLPWSMRRGIGAWKRLYMSSDPVVQQDKPDATIARGQELVEGLGHCGECHTSRDAFGGLQADRWLGGAPSLEGEGSIPNITPSGKNVSAWSTKDLSYYFESGFTPEFDTVGGTMVAVQENMAKLSATDREAIAAYLKSIPAVD